jgi:RHS repeat-associated protein
LLLPPLCAFALFVFSPSAHAQSWSYDNGQTFYSSVDAACQAGVAAWQAHEGGFATVTYTSTVVYWPDTSTSPTGFDCLFRSTFTQNSNPPYVDGGWIIVPFCGSGVVADTDTFGGCSPANGVQPGKKVGHTGAGCNSGCLDSTGGGSAGEPIDIGSGNVSYQVTDYTTAGQNPLAFTRYYNSRGGNLGFTTNNNWIGSFDGLIYSGVTTGVHIGVFRPDGKFLAFTNPNGSGWVSDTDVDYKLTSQSFPNNVYVYTLTTPDDTVETYTNPGTGTVAFLNSIVLRNGYTQTINRNSTNQITSVTDSYNRTLTFTYNSDHTINTLATPDSTTITYGYTTASGITNLTSVSYPTSPASSITYVYGNSSLPAALTSIKDELGNTYTSWTYDAYGRGLTSALGGSSLNANLTTITYNDTNGSRTVTNALGVTDTYSFTTLQNVTKVSQISRAATSTTAAATESFGYDSNGFLNSKTDWNGNQTTLTNNSHGLPTTINEAVGSSVARTTTIAYDPTFVHLPDSITTPGLTTSFTYDASGNVLTKTLTDTTSQSIPYSTSGQTRTWTNTWSNFLLATVKTPNGNTTTFGYDSTGALTSLTNAKNQVTNITSHTAGGLPETIVDPNGSSNGTTTTLSYDPRQRLTTKAVSSSAGTHTTTYTLDAAGSLTKLTLPDNSYISYVYDTAHRVTKATNALSEYQTYALDALGDRTQVNTFDASNTQWRQQAQTFDALGRQLTYVGGGNLDTTTFTYDKNGNVLTVKDGNNHTTTRVFDALNRLSTSTDANSGVTQFAYDAHDRTTSATDANGHATAYVYDGFGDTVQVASPDTGTSVYHYDSDANLTQKVDGAGVTANFAYDALDRIKSKSYPADSTQLVQFIYDTNGSPMSNNEIGRLSYINDAAGEVYFAYDAWGNVSHRERANKSYTDINDIWPTYDAANRPAGISYPSGLWVAYNRDTAGQLDNVRVCPPSQSCVDVDWVAYAPFFGPLRYESSGNNMRDDKGVDQDYRHYKLAIQSNGGSTNLINETLTYDAANNLTGISDSVNTYNNQTRGYDVINRLTSDTFGSGGFGSLAWQYDKVGNLTSQTVNSSTTTYGYTSGSNRLASITNGGTINVTTNGNGNITSIPPADQPGTAATFTYNVLNRLATVTGSPVGITATVYDGFGKRYSKQDPGSNPTLYSYDLTGHLIEENDNGTVTDYIYNNDVPVGLFVPSTGKLYFVHTDQRSTPLMVTDSSANIVWSTTYQPYGTTSIPIASITQNVRLPGQLQDTETGFYYNMNRDYMPNLGRYLEADPIGLSGGPNAYFYANGNPMRFVDRLGLDGGDLVTSFMPVFVQPPSGAGQLQGPVPLPVPPPIPQNSNAFQQPASGPTFPDSGPGTVVTSVYCTGFFCAGVTVTDPGTSAQTSYPTVQAQFPPSVGPSTTAVAASDAHNLADGPSMGFSLPGTGLKTYSCTPDGQTCGTGTQTSIKPNACFSFGFPPSVPPPYNYMCAKTGMNCP